MENPETDTKCTHLSEVPSSTQHSVIWLKKKNGARISKPNSMECKAELNPNLLQVAINYSIIVFDLSQLVPREMTYFNATHQFMNPEKYVESGT